MEVHMYVLGGAQYLLQLKCVEDTGLWSLLFMILIQLVSFDSWKNAANQNVHLYTGIEPRGAYNKLHTVTIELWTRGSLTARANRASSA